MEKIYTLVGKATIDLRMRIFQYKILNNLRYLNRQLYHMKVVNSPLCSLCGQNVETVTHLFFSCTTASFPEVFRSSTIKRLQL